MGNHRGKFMISNDFPWFPEVFWDPPNLMGLSGESAANKACDEAWPQGTPKCLAEWLLLVYFMGNPRENPIKMDDDWGYPHFRKPPYKII